VVFDGLIILHPDTLAPSPWIAKSWDILSDSQVRFYLNEGIKFHNGEDLTAEDVAFTFNWIADEANNSPNFTQLTWMQEAVVIDEYTVDIITKPEYTPFAPGFGTETQAIVPMDTVLDMGDEAFNLAPVGSGPYKFVEWLPGDRITVERNEDYWLVYPNLDTITYRPIPELSVQMLELESGGIDITDNMPAADVPRFMAMEDVNVQQVGSLSYFHM
jgi:peptide/nickel transport system substrate-binding protein